MGKRGPQPEPTIISMLKGNPSKKRIRDDEPMPDLLDDLDAPSYVNEDPLAKQRHSNDQTRPTTDTE